MPSENNQYILETYDRERQRQMLSFIAPAFAIIGALIFLAGLPALLQGPNQFYVITTILAGILAIVLSLETLLVVRGRILWAVRLHLTAGTVAAMSAVLVTLRTGLGPDNLLQFTALLTIILLAGVLGNLWTILATTVVMNGYTLGLVLLLPHIVPVADDLRADPGAVITPLILYQWVFALLTIGIWLTYRQSFNRMSAAYAQAQQLDNLKDQFITHVNHELRNPIMTLRGTVEYLTLAGEQMDAAERDDMLKGAMRTGDALVHLLQSILDVRTIEQGGPFTPEAVVVRDALDAAVALIDPRDGRLGQRDLQIRLPARLMVWADPIRFEQILANLLSNALKYSPAGTPIVVSGSQGEDAPARRGQAPRPWVEIAVADAGLGIPPEQAALLFRRFVRLPRDLGSSVTGSGLGLYLCRLFAEDMGGSIRVNSTGVPGEGSTFIVRLPAAPQSGSVVPTAPPIETPQQFTVPVAPAAREPLTPLVIAGREGAEAPYLIPNDLRETQRLDFQHFVLREYFQTNHLAPITQPRRILDVGTGTGRWAVEIAREFPDAEVIGVDVVSPTQVYTEANQEPPPNYRFMIANVLDGLPFDDGAFDYVHMRLLVAGIPATQWPQVIRELARVTAPGGWIESVEGTRPEGGGAALDQILDWFYQVSLSRGIDLLQGRKVGQWMVEQGLPNIQTREERVPFGAWGGRIGHLLALDYMTGIKGVGGVLAQAGLTTSQQFDALVQQADEDIHSAQYQSIAPIYIALSQQPI